MAREPRRHTWSLKSCFAVLGTLAAVSVAVAALLGFQMLRQTGIRAGGGSGAPVGRLGPI